MTELESRHVKNPLPDELPLPRVVERAAFEALLGQLRVREKALIPARETQSPRPVAAGQWWRWIPAHH